MSVPRRVPVSIAPPSRGAKRAREEREREAPVESILDRERPSIDALWNPAAPAVRAAADPDFDDALYLENARDPPEHAGPLDEILRGRPAGAYAFRTTRRRLVDAGDGTLAEAAAGPIRLVAVDRHDGGGAVSSRLVALDPDGTLWELALGARGRHARGGRVASLEAVAYRFGGRTPVAWRPGQIARGRDADLPPFRPRERTSASGTTLRLSGAFFRRLPAGGAGGAPIVYRLAAAPWTREGRPPGYRPEPGAIGEDDVYGVALSRDGRHGICGYRDGRWYDAEPAPDAPDAPDEDEAVAAAAPYPGDKYYLTPLEAPPPDVARARDSILAAPRYVLAPVG